MALSISMTRVQKVLERESQATNLRIMLIDQTGTVLADSGAGSQGARKVIDIDQATATENSSRPAILRDARRNRWVYAATNNGGIYYIVAAVALPRLPLITLVRNEVIAPILMSGAAALVISFILALVMANWISSPLQRMAAAAHRLTAGDVSMIRLEGPDEVKDLAQSLNQMTSQLHAGQQAQRDFVANVSHELKTPLTSIQGFSQAIVDGTANTPESLRDAAQVIFLESKRMYRLVMDLLTLTRLEGGTADLQFGLVDMAQLLTNITTKLAPQAAQAGVELSCIPVNIPMIEGDGDRLAQVFSNLVENALKNTPSGGRVTLQAKSNPTSLLVEVSDTGKGIRLEDQTRIFERFYQTDTARGGGSDHGVGLGLPIARQIVMAHRGKIWVESLPGMGSRFFVQLPHEQGEVSSTKPSKSKQAAG
jgi:signal transduction histidine kinase